MLSFAKADTSSGAAAAPKVIYLLPRMSLGDTPLVGVRKKILSQQLAFQASGFKCEVLDTPSTRIHLGQLGSKDINHALPKHRWLHSRLVEFGRELRRKISNAVAILGRLRKAGSVVLYVRHTSATPGLILFHLAIRTLPNIKRIYLEIPTWPYRFEHYARKSDRFFFPLMKFLVHRVVTYTASEDILGLHSICITNGVSAEDNPVSGSIGSRGEALGLVFVGQLHIWTGIDRLLIGLARYVEAGCRLGEVEFHIVGEGSMSTEWRTLASENGLQSQVFFYGGCTGERLDTICARSQLAVGNLANHRRKLTYSADLKTREYCMRGIPFIIASIDTAFPSSFEYVMRAPPTDSAINIEDLFQFRDTVRRQHPDYQQRMREFAMRNLTWETTMSPVFEDMREVFD